MVPGAAGGVLVPTHWHLLMEPVLPHSLDLSLGSLCLPTHQRPHGHRGAADTKVWAVW